MNAAIVDELSADEQPELQMWLALATMTIERTSLTTATSTRKLLFVRSWESGENTALLHLLCTASWCDHLWLSNSTKTRDSNAN